MFKMLEQQRKPNSQAGFHHVWTRDITHRVPLYWDLRCVIPNSSKPLVWGDRGACWVQENMLAPIMSSWPRKRCLIRLQEKKQSKWAKAEPPVLNEPQSDARITGGERKMRPVVGQNYTKWPGWEGPRFLVLVPGEPQLIGPSALRKPHQHVAVLMIPRGSTSCGPPDSARSGITTGCHHHRATAALQYCACRFTLRWEIKASLRKTSAVMEPLRLPGQLSKLAAAEPLRRCWPQLTQKSL